MFLAFLPPLFCPFACLRLVGGGGIAQRQPADAVVLPPLGYRGGPLRDHACSSFNPFRFWAPQFDLPIPARKAPLPSSLFFAIPSTHSFWNTLATSIFGLLRDMPPGPTKRPRLIPCDSTTSLLASEDAPGSLAGGRTPKRDKETAEESVSRPLSSPSRMLPPPIK